MNSYLTRAKNRARPIVRQVRNTLLRRPGNNAEGSVAQAATRNNVTPEVHQDDFIYSWLLQNPVFDSPQGAIDYYFDDGAKSAKKLSKLLDELAPERKKGYRLLEFASGYGCVTRHLGSALPDVEVTACDIHPAAMDFIESAIGTQTLLSHSVPEQFSSPVKYDAIFALSFFSHMPKSTWSRWVAALASCLTDDGVLIFTTHGVQTVRNHPHGIAFDDDGWWFDGSSEQGDLDTAEYGSTAVTAAWVFRTIDELPTDHRIIKFDEAAWWNHQDLYVLTRR